MNRCVWISLFFVHTVITQIAGMYTRGHIVAHTSYDLLNKHPSWPEISDLGGARAGLVSWGSFL